MSADKSANERFELTNQIAYVERQEDEFSELRNDYQRSLERFHEQFHELTRRRESALHEQLRSGSRSAQKELEARQEMLFQVNRYVDDSLLELEQASSQVRQSLDDERERLIRERDALPWE